MQIHECVLLAILACTMDHYLNNKARKEHLLVADELWNLFVPYLDSVPKKARKKEKELATKMDMLINRFSKMKNTDFDEAAPDEMI